MGQVLYYIFINDLPQVIQHSKIKTFEDNVKPYRRIPLLVDMALVWDDLKALINWCNLNSMFIN